MVFAQIWLWHSLGRTMIRGAVDQRTVYARYKDNVLGTDLDYAVLQYRKVVITVVVTNPPIGCKKGEIRET
jgi:hypothetical protein